MAEVRCPHGFMRSVVPCDECPPMPKAARTKATRAVSSERRSVRGARPRGQGEPNKLVGTYVCTACRVEKPLSEFYLSRTTKQGHQSRCKVCDNNMRLRSGNAHGMIVYDDAGAAVLESVRESDDV